MSGDVASKTFVTWAPIGHAYLPVCADIYCAFETSQHLPDRWHCSWVWGWLDRCCSAHSTSWAPLRSGRSGCVSTRSSASRWGHQRRNSAAAAANAQIHLNTQSQCTRTCAVYSYQLALSALALEQSTYTLSEAKLNSCFLMHLRHTAAHPMTS